MLYIVNQYNIFEKIKKQKLLRIKCEKNDVKKLEKNDLIDEINDCEIIKKKFQKNHLKKNPKNFLNQV